MSSTKFCPWDDILNFRLECVGRFPTIEEAVNTSLRPEVPIWLPEGPKELNDDVIPTLLDLRKIVFLIQTNSPIMSIRKKII